jgi:hypothetical protein
MCQSQIPTTFNNLSPEGQHDETPLSDIIPTRVLVATLHGKPYYRIISALKSLGMQFDSVSPADAALLNPQLVITTREERKMVGQNNIILDSELDDEPALIRAKILQRLVGMTMYMDDTLIVGIDPGRRIGVSAFYLQKEIESQVFTSMERVVDLVTVLVKGTASRKKLIRIGDGDPLMARSIAGMIYERFKGDIVIEFVNEHGTSAVHTMDSNRRGIRDRQSARAIAMRKGRVFRPVIIRN